MNGKFYVRKTDAEDRDLIGKYVVVDDSSSIPLRYFIDHDGNVVNQSDANKFFATREEAELALIVAKIKGVAT